MTHRCDRTYKTVYLRGNAGRQDFREKMNVSWIRPGDYYCITNTVCPRYRASGMTVFPESDCFLVNGFHSNVTVHQAICLSPSARVKQRGQESVSYPEIKKRYESL